MDKAPESKEVDLSGAACGVWLVKVPKYLSEKWKKAGNTADVGKLKISKPRVAGGKPEVIFSLDEELAKKDSSDLSECPRNHKFVLTGTASQALSVLSTEVDTEAVCNDDQFPPEKVAIEGKVIQRAECRPMADNSYIQLKRTQFGMMNKPQREVVHLSRAVNTYKPVNAHVHNIQADRNKKKECKRHREDSTKVQEALFSAFEKHQYYNVKDLVRITQQPITWLKDILKDICIYNMKAPHRNMWELKPEFRHYRSQQEKS